jgi:mono/diheme cytochrome c family protein
MKTHSLPRPRAALSTAGALIFALVGPPIAPGRSADAEGWYTQAQAEQGHQLFNNYCAECHRPDLTGAMGPALVGDAFLKRWGNRPLGDLFGFEHSKMPAVNPGSVPDSEMWTITAYILQKNGFPPGSTALSRETGAKRTLTAK